MSKENKMLKVGDTVPSRELEGLRGSLQLPAASGFTHVQFLRFAGCPVCDYHLHTFVLRQEALATAGITELVVFHATKDELLIYEANLPFGTLPDPTKALYRAFGAERTQRLSNFRLPIMMAFPRVFAGLVGGLFSGTRRPPPFNPTGGMDGLVADVLLDSKGKVVAVKYGAVANDQWSVDEVIKLAGNHGGK